MRIRSISAVLMLAATGFVPVAVTPAEAGPLPGGVEGKPGGTHCLAEFDLVFTPGVSMEPASHTFTSGGETGTSKCDGPVNGFEVTGAGTRGEEGTSAMGASCQGGDVEFTFSFTQPTKGGPQKVTGKVEGTYGSLQGGWPVGGTFTGPEMYGEFTFYPLEGDCITTPVTKIHVYCDEWVVTKAR